MPKQLTRNEAIDAYWRNFPHEHHSSGSRHVDFLTAIGVFTPAEPKTVDEEAITAATANCAYSHRVVSEVIGGMIGAGFKIVKA